MSTEPTTATRPAAAGTTTSSPPPGPPAADLRPVDVDGHRAAALPGLAVLAVGGHQQHVVGPGLDQLELPAERVGLAGPVLGDAAGVEVQGRLPGGAGDGPLEGAKLDG